MTSNNKTIVWFDTETTGLDTKTDRIIQIGMIKTDMDMNIIDAIEQKFNPCGVKSTEEALEKHHITDEELLAYPSFSEAALKILEFMKDSDIGGHNVIKFDIPFLIEEMSRCGIAFTIEKRRIIDTYVLDRHYNPRTLECVYNDYCEDEPLECDTHDAICDTQMCVNIYKSMLKRHTPTQKELDTINGNNTRIDVSGFFVFDENMKVCMGKGKYAGKHVEDVDPSYFSWMIKQDFLPETKNLASRCLTYLSSKSSC